MNLKIGDIVTLKINDIQMIVDSIFEDEIWCVWHSKDGKIQVHGLSPHLLRKVG